VTIVDTDVLIWNLRGDTAAAAVLDEETDLRLSAVTYMELTQGLRDSAELRTLRQAMAWWCAEIVHITEAISARATFLVEQFALSHSLKLADALIAATALEKGHMLLTANDKHYRAIETLELSIFRPQA
jgi:predicted nucleic acid-binding protein